MTTRAVRTRVWVVGATAILALAAATGCADDNETPAGPTSNTYQGGYADNGNGIGGLNFTIAATLTQTADNVMGGTAVEATGSVHANGGPPVALSGFYNPDSFTITLSQLARGNNAYALTGLLQGGSFRGTITTPSGNGGFAAVPVASVAADTIYCGAYNCESCEGGGGGYFDSIVFGSSVVIGVRSFEDNVTSPIAGTRNGNAITVNDQGISASGTISGSSVSGTYAVSADQETGTWSGSTECFGKRRS